MHNFQTSMMELVMVGMLMEMLDRVSVTIDDWRDRRLLTIQYINFSMFIKYWMKSSAYTLKLNWHYWDNNIIIRYKFSGNISWPTINTFNTNTSTYKNEATFLR